MNKNIKKYLCMLLVLVMAASVLVGCAKDNETAADEKDNQQAETKDNTSGQADKSVPEKQEPVKLKVLTYALPTVEYNDDVPVLAEIQKRTNTDIEWQNLPVGNEQEKLDVLFAGHSLPDIIIYPYGDRIAQLGSEGAFIPLEDLIDQHAPNIKKAFEKYEKEIDEFKARTYSSDGHIYNIPSFAARGANCGMVWAIREDWCKNVGMSIPETTDDLYNVLKAFKEKDPNKNGEADELPMVSRNSKSYPLFLANSFGEVNGLYWDEEEQRVKFGPLEPGFKDALAFIHRLYAEGLLDNEFITNTDDQFKAKITDNKAGFFLGYVNSHIAYGHDELKKQNKEFNLVPMLPVKGPNGDQFKQNAGNLVMYRGTITSSCKNPEAAIKFLDYGFSDEGHELFNWGIEEKTYIKVNGKYQVLDYVMRNPDGMGPQEVLDNFGIHNPLPHAYSLEAYTALSSPFVEKVLNMYNNPGILMESFQCALNKEEADIANPALGNAWDYASPKIMEFITGQEPIENFDEYVKTANELGMKTWLDMYTQAYKRQYNK